MPHLVQPGHDGAALGLGLLGVHFGEALDPGLHRGRRHAEQLGGAVHRRPAQVQQHRLDLDPQRHATGRRVGGVQPAGLAPVAPLAAHEPVLDVLPAPAPLAPQPHPLTPSAVPLPTHMGDLCGLETDRPWSQYFCCMLATSNEYLRQHPVAIKRAMRAIFKSADICAADPAMAAQRLVAGGCAPRYDETLELLSDLPYARWREFDPEDTMRFYALRLHEVDLIKSSPNRLIAEGTDWRFLNEIKRELKA